jgi:hypothetical protein
MAQKPVDHFPRRFIFHGNAVAAEVFLTRTGEIQNYDIHPVNGQSSLPVIGGHSESAVLEPQFPGELAKVFAYGECRTMADGRFDAHGVAVTIVQSAVSGVRVTNEPAPGESGPSPSVFKADMLSLAIQSRHPLKGQPSIDFMETPQFQGLSLDGLPIEVELNEELMRLGRYRDLEKKFRTSPKFFQECRDSFATFGRKRPLSFGAMIPRAGGYALCSFVRSIRWGDQVIPGHVLVRQGFGSIYFGEILLNDRERRVTMVRMQLGSQYGGQASLAETAPNGTWIPPRP